MKRIYFLATAITLAFALSSCKTQHDPNTPSGENPAVGSIELSSVVKGIWDARVEAKNLTANLDVTLNIGSKEISCDGRLRMKRDDVVQLSLTLPLLGTEVGRLECTPDEVLIVDRINRQYCRAKYSDVRFLADAGLDFYSLQAVFWDEIFVPGEKSPKNAFDRFRISASGEHILLSLTDTPKLEYDFLTLRKEKKVDRLSVRRQGNAESDEFVCVYDNFTTLNGQWSMVNGQRKKGGRLFPQSIRLSFSGSGRNAGLSLSLSRLGDDSKWQTRTTLSQKYSERSAEDILRLISNL